MRLDKYLKLSRVIKRRTVANNICDNDKVFVNDKLVKASYAIKVGDKISIHYGDSVIDHVVTNIPYERSKYKNNDGKKV